MKYGAETAKSQEVNCFVTPTHIRKWKQIRGRQLDDEDEYCSSFDLLLGSGQAFLLRFAVKPCELEPRQA